MPTRTRADITALAFRRLGILAADAPLTADMEHQGRETLTLLTAELAHPVELTPEGADEIPEATALALADLLAVELAPGYAVPPPNTRARALMRLRAMAFPDDREAETTTTGDYD